MPATLDRNETRRYARALAATYARADADTRAYGAEWYGAARDFAADLSERYALPLESVACAIAALSPRSRWSENRADAERLCRWYDAERDAADGYGHFVPLESIRRDFYAVNIRQIYKAVDCLGCADPLAAGILRGPKERAFAANILGDSDAVTVDSWIYAVALRQDTARGARVGQRSAPTAREYELITRAMRAAARHENRPWRSTSDSSLLLGSDTRRRGAAKP